MANPTERATAIQLNNPGPLDSWEGPYNSIAEACAKIKNIEVLQDGVMVNFRLGKKALIRTDGKLVQYWWPKGRYEDVDLEMFVDLSPITNNFTIQITNDTLYNGAIQPALDVYLWDGATPPNDWRSGNKSAIVPVVPGHTVRISGRNNSTLQKKNTWLTTSSHVVGTLPDLALGTYAASTSTGDGDYSVPENATFLYILFDNASKASIVVTDLTNNTKMVLKEGSLPESVTEGFSESVRKDQIDINVTGGAEKVAAADAFKKVADKFENDVIAKVLFNGASEAALSMSINEGAVKDWRDTNKCAIVPVIPGHTIKIEGRSGSTLGLTNLWLTNDSHVLGETPAFFGGSFTPAYFQGDIEKAVPAGASFLYCLVDPPRAATLKITDLTSQVRYQLKNDAVPQSIVNEISKATADISTLGKNPKLVLTSITDVAITRDCNIYFDAITTEPDQVRMLQHVHQCNETAFLRGQKNVKYKPANPKTNFTVSFAIRDRNFAEVDKVTKTIRTVARSGGVGQTIRMMFLGDSFIHMGLLSKEVYALLAADGDYVIQPLGTRAPQFTGPVIEGYSGWSWNNFVNLDSAPVGGVNTVNPFRSGGVLNIPNYFATQGYSGIDIMVINLGVNDFNFTNSIISDSGIADRITWAKTYMSAVLAYAPNCKIILTLPTIGGEEFSTNVNIQAYRKYNCQRGALAYIANFDNGKFHPNVSLSDAGQWIDRKNGYSLEEIDSANRLPGVKEMKSKDPVHPNEVGFAQMADGVYSRIRAVLAGL